MPHSAFQLEPVMENLSQKVESIATWEDRVIVGTSEGALLVLQERPDAHIPEYEVVEQRKNFAKKPIVQLEVCPELRCIISLSDTVQINTVPSLDMRACLLKTRGANLFAVTTQGETPMMVAAIKKKLVLYKWNYDCFDEWKEINLSDNVKSLVWCGRCLCAGYKREYVLVNVGTHQISELFSTGKSGNSVVFRMPGEELLLARDNITVFQDFDGKPTRKYGLSWSDPPMALAHSFPYVLAATGRMIEVQTAATQALVQQLRIASSHLVTSPDPSSPVPAFAVANNAIYRLQPVPIAAQVEQLVSDSEFTEALSLCRVNTTEDMTEKIKEIHLKFGCHLWQQGSVVPAMSNFHLAAVDPRLVLSAFPDLSAPPPLDGSTLPIGPQRIDGDGSAKPLAALADYLRQVQSKIADAPGDDDTLAQVVDTALLKVVVRIQPETALALLSGNNHCQFGESERLLLQYQLYPELVALYKSTKNHRRAIDLLSEHGQGPREHPLYGTAHIVDYLSSLGKEYEPLILDASRWVLRQSPTAGLKIFTNEDLSDDQVVDPAKVLQHLELFDSDRKGGAPPLCMSYLEHILEKREAIAPTSFANELILLYLDAVQHMKFDTVQRPTARVEAGRETGPLGVARRRLLQFLTKSKLYDAEKMLAKFPVVDLYEERALLLSRLGRHDEALGIFTHRLQAPHMAEDYCNRVFDPADPDTREVHLMLLGVYLHPPDGAPPQLGPAMRLMSNHLDKIDPAKALDLLPAGTTVRALQPFFEVALRANSQTRRHGQVRVNLLKAENIQVWETAIQAKTKRVRIGSDRVCQVCNRRIGSSVFACYPNLVVVHFGCAKDRNVCPVTGTVFNNLPKQKK